MSVGPLAILVSMPTLLDRWKDLLAGLHVAGPSATAVGERLIARWQESHRHYHSVTHLIACLDQLHAWHQHAQQAHHIALAVWFHDAIYNPQASDNEAASAQLLSDSNRALGLHTAIIDRCAELIIATDHRQVVADSDHDAQLLVDIDLAILGTDPDIYDAYATAVRREYDFVPDDSYRTGRSQVLRTFLAREDIYTSPPARALEQGARCNLQRELEALQTG